MSMSPEEQAQLEQLTADEMSSGAEPKFGWDDTFQRKLLAMLMCDRFFLTQGIGLVEPKYFSSESHAKICELLFKYFAQYKSLPEPFLLEEELKVATQEQEESTRIHHQGELKALYTYYVPGLETRDALLDKIMYFAKVQAVKVAFHEILPKITEKPEDEATWAYVYEEWRKAMIIDRTHEPGIDYFENLDEFFDLLKQKQEIGDGFTSSFESIDNSLTGGQLYRGEIGAWIGLPGSGKSLALVKAAVANVKLGHKVLYITLEMDEPGICSRFTSQLLKKDVNDLLAAEAEIREEARQFTMDMADKNRLIVKQFPGGQLDVNGVRAFYSQCQLRGFKPDLLIVDYVGEMKQDPNVKTYESMYHILRDLRGFGVEENHCTLTAVQPNRSASELTIKEYIDESNIGSSFDQFKPLDAFWSLNQTVNEKSAEVGRGFVIKHRNGRSRFPFKMGYDYALGTLDIFEISAQAYKEKRHFAQENEPTEENLEEDFDEDVTKKKSKKSKPPKPSVKKPGQRSKLGFDKPAGEETEPYPEPELGEGA
jgi:replicative DNA helicase